MSEQTKTIKTRLLNKYDTESNWTDETKAGNYVPPEGELIISASDTLYHYPRIRVGDGAQNLKQLPVINPQVDWESSESKSYDYILNKPMLQNSLDKTQVEVTAERGLVVKCEGTTPTNITANDITVGNKSTVYYTNSMQMPHDVGGIPAGETFENTHIQDLLTALLYPYTEPVLDAFTLNPDQGIREKGTSCELTTASITVGKRSANITKIELYRDGEVIKTLDGDALSGINFDGVAITLLSSLDEAELRTVNSLSSSVKFKVIVTDARNGTQTSEEKTYNFVYPMLHGVVNGVQDITESWINSALTDDRSKTIKNKGNTSITYTTDAQIPVFAYPASYGSLKSIVDPNNFTQTWASMTLDLTHELSGATVPYLVYYGGLSTASNVTYKFNW